MDDPSTYFTPQRRTRPFSPGVIGGGGGPGITFNKIINNSTPGNPILIDPAATLHDVLIGGFVTDAQNASYAATGFNSLGEVNTSFDGQSLGALRKKDATGSEGNVSISGATNLIGFIMSLTGANNITSEDVTTVTAVDNAGTASPWTIDASITPVTDGCMIVAIMGSDSNSGDVVHSFATVSGTTGAWNVRADLNSTFWNIAVATAMQTTAGAITVRGTGTLAGGTAAKGMILIAVRPA